MLRWRRQSPSRWEKLRFLQATQTVGAITLDLMHGELRVRFQTQVLLELSMPMHLLLLPPGQFRVHSHRPRTRQAPFWWPRRSMFLLVSLSASKLWSSFQATARVRQFPRIYLPQPQPPLELLASEHPYHMGPVTRRRHYPGIHPTHLSPSPELPV